MSVSGDEPVDRVANGRGNDAGQLQQSPWPAEVRRHPQGRSGVGKDAFRSRTVGRFDEQHRIEPANLGMSPENGATRRAIERGETQRSLAVARQDKLYALGAETAASVVQENG